MPVLKDQIVPYCFGWDLWHFKLPDIRDDQNSTVEISAQFDKFAFAFDRESNLLSQKVDFRFDQNFTVKFILKN